jgi:hypothetical protein
MALFLKVFQDKIYFFKSKISIYFVKRKYVKYKINKIINNKEKMRLKNKNNF